MHEKLGESEKGSKVHIEADPTEFTPPIPFSAQDIYEHLVPEEQGVLWSTEQDKKKSAEMKNFL